MKTNILHYTFGTFILLLLIIAFGSVAKAQNLENERQLFKQIDPSQSSAFGVGKVANYQNHSFLFSVWSVDADRNRLIIEPKTFLVPGNQFSILPGSSKIGANIVLRDYVDLVSGNYEFRVQLCAQGGDPCGSFSKDPIYIAIVVAEVTDDEKAIEKTKGAINAEIEKIRLQAVEEVEEVKEVKEKGVFGKLLDRFRGLFKRNKDNVFAQECTEIQRILESVINRSLHTQPSDVSVVRDTVDNFASQFADLRCLGSENLDIYLKSINEPTIKGTCEALNLSGCEFLGREVVRRRRGMFSPILIQNKEENEKRQKVFRKKLEQLKGETNTNTNNEE